MEDDSGRLELRRRTLLGATVTTGAAAASAGAGTWAYFQDTEESTGNDLRAGTMDLTVENGATLAWTIDNAAPGDGQERDLEVNLANVGSVPADHVEVGFENTPHEDADGDLSTDDSGPESDTMPDSAAGMAEHVRVERLEYTETDGSIIDLLDQVADANGNGIKDLDDLTASVNDGVLDDLSTPEVNGGTETEFDVRVTVDPSMGNDYQGDVLETTVTFALHQDPSQDL